MIGVCIKYFHENYGGMLQAYATTALLEKYGLDYELIQYEKKLTVFEMIRSIPRLLNGVLLLDKYELFLKKRGLRNHPEFAQNDSIRMACFQKFRNEHFTKLSPIFRGYDMLCAGANRYTAVVTGSDQLWSPAGLPTNFYNLMFVPDGVRKISYASSFGVAQIPWYQKKRTAHYLRRIDYVSMRENRGAQIVTELTGRAVPTVLDPVFMFDRDDWQRMLPEHREIQESYLFAYFLGSNVLHRAAVKKAAEELNCKIVTLPHLDQYVEADENFGDIALYDVGPERFLNLVRGAAYVCTDSFHGSCFSILYGKPFVVFDRYEESNKHSKNSRIDTLCSNLALVNRRFESGEVLAEQLGADINWDAVGESLRKMRKESEAYLEEAFKGIQ